MTNWASSPSRYAAAVATSSAVPTRPVAEASIIARYPAAPGPDIVGATATYQTVLDNYVTYAALAGAFATYQDVLDLIAEPSEVIVS